MDNRKKRNYLDVVRAGYQALSKAGKSKKLDEMCSILGWNRKSILRLLNNQAQKTKGSGRPKKYSLEAIKHLCKLWKGMEQMCSRKMVVALHTWLPYYKECSGSVKQEILSMSASTIDRYLRPYRVRWKRALRSGTRPGSMKFKNRIPIKPLDHKARECGHIEADTVAHCGDSMSGTFAWSLTLVDKKTGWTELTAMWGKGSKGVIEGITASKENMPFEIQGFYCDNGSEFLNAHLLRYFSSFNNKEKKAILQRGRPYKKNDQCHVEQKNYTHVRQLFGYNRISHPEVVALMNDIYLNTWSKLQNFFIPQMKLLSKTRIGAKYKRVYSKPLTPFERVLAEPSVPAHTKHQLRKEFRSLNPIELKSELESKARRLFRLLENQTIRRVV